MRFDRVFTAALIGLAAISTTAAAQTGTDGYYARLDLGWGFARDANATGGGINGDVDGLRDSPVAGLGAGYRFNRHLRADLTSGYAWGHRLSGADSAGVTWNADIDAWTTLANVYFDYPVGDWSPYVTAGAGLSRNRTGALSSSAGTSAGSHANTAFAWQAGLGVAYSLTPEWIIDAGYRYLDAGDFVSGETGNGKVNGDLRSHVALIGLRYNFNRPAAMPAPAPTPAAMTPPAPVPAPPPPVGPELPVQYLVFFEWDRFEISAESERVLKEAAATAHKVPITRIVATGHADRSGPERYNMGLSLRRANAVKAILLREGIAENQIVVIGKGETQPLVQTADGVREPRNRRVEIVLE